MAGRPTDYLPRYCDEMRDFFMGWPEYVIHEEQVASAGRKVTIEIKKPNKPPTINKFAIKLGFHRDTLKDWCKQDDAFLRTYNLCKMIQEEFISDKGLMGEYNAGFAKLLLVNHCDIKDKVEHDLSDDAKKGLRLAYSVGN